jgi:hypothetical protein
MCPFMRFPFRVWRYEASWVKRMVSVTMPPTMM